MIKKEVGQDQILSTVGFVGAQPPTYPINTIYLWSSGSQEAVLQIALKKDSNIRVAFLKEKLRERFSKELPEVSISFEASSLVDLAMSQGSSTPIEIAVHGRDFQTVRAYAAQVKDVLTQLPFLRDLQYGQIFDYPAVAVNVDRRKAGLMGLTMSDIGQALVPATSSSRFILQNYWSDPKNGINYQVQVEVPQGDIQSIDDIRNIPVSLNGGAILLKQFSDIHSTTAIGEYDRYNMQRMVTLKANLFGKDLGHAAEEIKNQIKHIEKNHPKGIDLHVRGQISAMSEMFQALSLGLALAILVIFLLLSANFESITLSMVVLSTAPAVLCGAGLALLLTKTTLNIESFMGTIVAIGVAVANAILLVTFAEKSRLENGDSAKAATEGAQSRLRPILMTGFAMIVGMTPMALGLGEGGGQTAPLGRAVIGGLSFATLATLFILPLVYEVIQCKRTTRSPSLDPDDPKSIHSEMIS